MPNYAEMIILFLVPESSHEPTTTLYIKNFVRPFTVQALQNMLSDYGHIVSFWMDTIKTHCYVTYETISEATNARNDLYNRVWPPTTGRPLIAEFISEILSREYIQIENSGGLPQVDKSQEVSRPPTSHESTTTGERIITPMDSAKEISMPQPVSKSLDELFRRTVTRPALYYLPLTKRQIEERQASRLSSRM